MFNAPDIAPARFPAITAEAVDIPAPIADIPADKKDL